MPSLPPRLPSWFAGTRVIDEFGGPLVVYRGEHGPPHCADDQGSCEEPFGLFQTRLPTLSFGSASAARLYATKPNNRNDVLISPRLFSGYLCIQNPVMNRPDDQFVELEDIARAIGKKAAREAAVHFKDHITNTCNWIDDIGMKFETFENYLNSRSFNLSDLYFDAYALFDDTHHSAIFRDAGYDGAIHGGCGETSGEPEYKVFSPEQVWLLSNGVSGYEKLAR